MVINTKIPANSIKAIIFDLDGTLLDTEGNWFLADQKMLKQFNIDLTAEMKKQYIGGSIQDMLLDLLKKYPINASYEELFQMKNNYYLEFARGNTDMFPEMKALYQELKKLDLPFAIASGTAYHMIIQLLTDLKIVDEFQSIVSAEQVKSGKPAPDIFIHTAARLDIKPENILVFEDSVFGVEAAKKAGMYCIAIPYLPSLPLAPAYQQADLLIEEGMPGLKVEKILQWINSSYQYTA